MDSMMIEGVWSADWTWSYVIVKIFMFPLFFVRALHSKDTLKEGNNANVKAYFDWQFTTGLSYGCFF